MTDRFAGPFKAAPILPNAQTDERSFADLLYVLEERAQKVLAEEPAGHLLICALWIHNRLIAPSTPYIYNAAALSAFAEPLYRRYGGATYRFRREGETRQEQVEKAAQAYLDNGCKRAAANFIGLASRLAYDAKELRLSVDGKVHIYHTAQNDWIPVKNPYDRIIMESLIKHAAPHTLRKLFNEQWPAFQKAKPDIIRNPELLEHAFPVMDAVCSAVCRTMKHRMNGMIAAHQKDPTAPPIPADLMQAWRKLPENDYAAIRFTAAIRQALNVLAPVSPPRNAALELLMAVRGTTRVMEN
ncbi:MAG: hypothetical protein AB7G80_05030 [Dongiaceae bacterium]